MSALIRSRLIYLRCVRSGCEQSQQGSPLFDHLVGPRQEGGRYRQTERLGGLHISALAVFILMTSWKRVGCSTGKSAGWAPFRILSTYTAALRKRSAYIAEYDISPPSSANHRGTETAGAKERRAVHLRAGAVRCCNPTVRGGRRPILASGLPSSGEGVAHPDGGGLDDVRP